MLVRNVGVCFVNLSRGISLAHDITDGENTGNNILNLQVKTNKITTISPAAAAAALPIHSVHPIVLINSTLKLSTSIEQISNRVGSGETRDARETGEGEGKVPLNKVNTKPIRFSSGLRVCKRIGWAVESLAVVVAICVRGRSNSQFRRRGCEKRRADYLF